MIDIADLVRRAQELDAERELAVKQEFYRRVVGWFCYLGLLRSNTIDETRATVTLDEVLRAAELEPRILEILPAVLLALPTAIKHADNDIPKDLLAVLRAIKARRATHPFRDIPPQRYLHWLTAPAMDLARRRVDFHRLPRRRRARTSAIGETVRALRLEASLTQQELAKRHHVSLRVVRDLEQGKLSASLGHVVMILGALGRHLVVSKDGGQ